MRTNIHTNIHITEFNLAEEMYAWKRRGLGRPMVRGEEVAIYRSLESNEIYSEFFDNLEAILAAAI
jgi:hypothetical protein